MSSRFLAPVAVLLSIASTLPAAAQSVGPEVVPDFFAAPAEPAPPPLRLAESLAPQAATSLESAEVGARDALEALHAWNRAGHLPLRAGLVRTLPTPLKARLATAVAAPAGSRVWGTRFDVDGAQRLRLHLTQVSLPAGSLLWIYAPGETPRAFGLDLLGPDGALWTPSVTGGIAFLEVEAPADAVSAALGFTVGEILEGVLAPPAPLEATDCLIDGTCTSNGTLANIADYRKAVGQLAFVISSFEYLCSGALVNDSDTSTTVPYLLTANHCIDSQSAASTLEVFWDYKTASCDGSVPALGSLPRSNGSTLVATGEDSDFTLLRLASIPSGRVLLGWNANASAVPNGTTIYRLSHPAPFDDQYALPQQFSRGAVRTSGIPLCTDAPRPDFLYSQLNQGGTFGGSSGSPVVLANLQIVGQLTGGCGDDPDDGCDYSNSELDGAFSATYPSLQAFLNPTTSGSCVADADTLCLNSGRFKVEATFNTSGAPVSSAKVVKLTDETGYLWFFNATNVEAIIKVLNGCGANNRYWVFAGGLTNVRTVITVTDTKTGTQKTYTNPQGTAFQPIQDTSAFATCP
jgi:hypothetical protein